MTPGKVTLNLDKSKFDKEGVLTYAHYEPDEQAIAAAAPVVLLMEYAETLLFNGELQGKAEATPAPYWAKKGLELSGQDFIDQYSGLIDERLLNTRVQPN